MSHPILHKIAEGALFIGGPKDGLFLLLKEAAKIGGDIRYTRLKVQYDVKDLTKTLDVYLYENVSEDAFRAGVFAEFVFNKYVSTYGPSALTQPRACEASNANCD